MYVHIYIYIYIYIYTHTYIYIYIYIYIIGLHNLFRVPGALGVRTNRLNTAERGSRHGSGGNRSKT